ARMTDKQDRFVTEYLIDLNATQAAVRAGYSPKVANREGSRLLSKADIQTAIAAGKAAQLHKADLTAVRGLEEQRRLGLSDIGALFDEHGKLRPLHTLSTEVRATIASVKITGKNLTAGDGVQEDVVEVKLWDKVRALEALAKHFGLLVERVEL